MGPPLNDDILCSSNIRCTVCIITVGSRGDVEPFVYLARELVDRGHDVIFCTHESLRSLVVSLFDSTTSSGWSFVGLGGDPTAFFREPRVQKLLQNNNMVSSLMAVQYLVGACYLSNAQVIRVAAETKMKTKMKMETNMKTGVDGSIPQPGIVIAGLPVWSMGLVLAEGWDVPVVLVCFMAPALPAPDLAPPLLSTTPLPFGWMNYAAGR